MRTWTRAVPAVAGALVLTVAVTGCNSHSSSKKSKKKSHSRSHSSHSGSRSSKEKTTFRLGQASPVQKSDKSSSRGARYTVTPTKVQTGTKADMDNSGLKKDEDDGPQIPVYVWSTLENKGGKPMELGDMDDDLVVKTDKNKRTRALIVLLGQAKWPNCPSFDSDKEMKPGDSEKICSAFLVPAGQKAAAVELNRGFSKAPLEWPVTR
ncbi:hypothetical protein AN217_02870 [Streptomyces qinglanensis]|uniref:DUF4352 domain-containing protein n=1 Tax=Streptomyces qinglanensis TaxID=943816 RepID=A0A1E7KE62_9ACTN|nr:hypothetical protein AN217_02870 [Streptomyces qinglanensis]OEV26566.1 hypothetical protein AN220_07860 [Streptomyces nanshensis]